VLAGALAALFSGCAHRASAPLPVPVKIGSTETGTASWYGAPYDGRVAASGEIYDMRQLTAAHRTLPFGTWLEVTDLDNGKKVEVRINDRGPFAGDRIIDLSFAAAEKIEMVGPGTARVRLRVTAPPEKLYAVQAGAFSTLDRAEALAASLRKNFGDARVVQARTVWRVLVGHDLQPEDAKTLAKKVHKFTGAAEIVPAT